MKYLQNIIMLAFLNIKFSIHKNFILFENNLGFRFFSTSAEFPSIYICSR